MYLSDFAGLVAINLRVIVIYCCLRNGDYERGNWRRFVIVKTNSTYFDNLGPLVLSKEIDVLNTNMRNQKDPTMFNLIFVFEVRLLQHKIKLHSLS